MGRGPDRSVEIISVNKLVSMQINIKATAIELTPAIYNYVMDKMTSCKKFLNVEDEEAIKFNVEVGKTTRHHKEGDLFRAEVNLNFNGQILRVEKTEEDLYAAIDVAKDELIEQINNFNKKKNTLFKRGARALKSVLKGISRGWRRQG